MADVCVPFVCVFFLSCAPSDVHNYEMLVCIERACVHAIHNVQLCLLIGTRMWSSTDAVISSWRLSFAIALKPVTENSTFNTNEWEKRGRIIFR